MIKNRDIIITGLQAWDQGTGRNFRNIALELSKFNRVLYVNPQQDRFSELKKRTQGIKTKRTCSAQVQEIGDRLWLLEPESLSEPISRLPINFLFDRLQLINNRRFAREIRAAIGKLGFKDYIHFCDNDIFHSYHLKELLGSKTYVYYSRDNLLGVKYWQTQGTRIEPRHMAKADVVVSNSVYLADLAKQYNPRSYFVGQGFDLETDELQNTLSEPMELPDLPRPVIGYIGALNSRKLNLQIIEFLAMQRPDWSFVLLGPEDATFKKSFLHLYTNIHFTGSKPETELASYINSFDVAINPQKLDPVTIGNYPKKIDAYLALGKPVVATKTRAMDYFSSYVDLVSHKEAWPEAIEKAIITNNHKEEQRRIQFAREHSWENNVNNISSAIETAEKASDRSKSQMKIRTNEIYS